MSLKDPAARKAYASSDKVRAKKQAYNAAHRAEIQAQNRARYAANKEQNQARARDYARAHKEERASYMDTYKAEHREALRASTNRYRPQRTEEQKEKKRQADRDYYHRNSKLLAVKQQEAHIAHKAERNEKMRAYAKLHAEERHARYAANRQAEHEKGRLYRATHREELRAYRLQHKEEQQAYEKAWRQAHPEVGRLKAQKRRARKMAAPLNNFTKDQWHLLQETFHHCCAYCGKRAKGHLTQDHIQPLSKGGSHTLQNIVPSCKSCNCRKHTGPPPIAVQPIML